MTVGHGCITCTAVTVRLHDNAFERPNGSNGGNVMLSWIILVVLLAGLVALTTRIVRQRRR